MKQFNGRIQRLNVLKGRMLKKLHGLKISILPINTHPKAEIKPLTQYRATWDKGISFGALVKRLNAIFRFLSAKARIINKHEAKVISAPAVDVEVDSAIQLNKEAPLIACPVPDMQVDQKQRVSVYAKLVAYRRAGLKYIKQLFFKRKAELQAAPGAVAKYNKAVKMKLTAKAATADSAIMESRFNKVQTGCEATGTSAPAQIVPAIENTFSAEHTATASTGTAVAVGINHLFRAVHRAPLASWFLPEQNGDELKFFQVFSGIQSGNVLEIDLEEESAYWANATVTDGTLNLVFAETATPNDTILEVV